MPRAQVQCSDWHLATSRADEGADSGCEKQGAITYLRPSRDLLSELLQRYENVYADWATVKLPNHLRLVGFTAEMDGPRKIDFPDLDWFLANFDQLVAEYRDRWLAIVNRRVEAHASSPKELRQVIKEKGITKPFIAHASPRAWGRSE